MRNCSCKVLNDIYCNAVSALNDTQVEYKSACDACNEFDAARDFAFCLPNISISHRASIPNLPVSTFPVILSGIGKFFIASRSESHSP